MRILIIRHGDPEYAGDTLTEHGWSEARALAAHLTRPALTNNHGKLSSIYSSPMGRARATASCTEEASGLAATVEEWTREITYWPRLDLTWGGKNDAGGKAGEGGLAVWDVPGDIVRAAPGISIGTEFAAVASIASAEAPYAELRAASDAFLQRLGYVRGDDGVYKVEKANRDTVAVFCHGGFGLTWLAHLLGLPVAQVWSAFYMAPSSVTTVVFDERAPGRATARAISVGDVSHLAKAGLETVVSKYEKANVFSTEARPSGIKANFY